MNKVNELATILGITAREPFYVILQDGCISTFEYMLDSTGLYRRIRGSQDAWIECNSFLFSILRGDVTIPHWN